MVAAFGDDAVRATDVFDHEGAPRPSLVFARAALRGYSGDAVETCALYQEARVAEGKRAYVDSFEMFLQRVAQAGHAKNVKLILKVVYCRKYRLVRDALALGQRFSPAEARDVAHTVDRTRRREQADEQQNGDDGREDGGEHDDGAKFREKDDNGLK